MNINDISTQLIYTTVPIYSQDLEGNISTGTGFIFSIKESDNISIPMLITNYHVLKDAIAGFFELHLGKDGLPTSKSIRVQFDKSIINNNKLGNLDLIAVPLAGTFEDLQMKHINLFYRSIDQSLLPDDDTFNDFSALEDIIFIGYPRGLYDTINKISIIRQGITATPIWNKFENSDVFLIDAGAFPGSSGSPVFIYNPGSFPTKDGIAIGNRILFVGILYQTITESAGDKKYLNLGRVINSRAFYKELQAFVGKYSH